MASPLPPSELKCGDSPGHNPATAFYLRNLNSVEPGLSAVAAFDAASLATRVFMNITSPSVS